MHDWMPVHVLYKYRESKPQVPVFLVRIRDVILQMLKLTLPIAREMPHAMPVDLLLSD